MGEETGAIMFTYLVPLAKSEFSTWIEPLGLLDVLESCDALFVLVSCEETKFVGVFFSEKGWNHTISEQPLVNPCLHTWEETRKQGNVLI